jgi:hypothetical protein
VSEDNVQGTGSQLGLSKGLSIWTEEDGPQGLNGIPLSLNT